MKNFNGWQRLWVSVTLIYLLIVLVGAYLRQPESVDVQTADVLPFISTGTLKLMQAMDRDEAWRDVIEDGVTVPIPPHFDASLAKAYTAEYLAGHATALRNMRLDFSALAIACWSLPSLLLLAIGFLIAWVRRGFAARAA